MSEYNPSAKQQWTPIEPSPAPVETQAWEHDPDCDCYGDTVEHLPDCGNCTCEKPDCSINMKPGWKCTRKYHSDGPCALVPVPAQASESELPIPDDLKEMCKDLSHPHAIEDGCLTRDGARYLIERIARLEQEVARLRDSHGKQLEAIIGYRSGRLTSREFFAAAEKITAPSEGKG